MPLKWDPDKNLPKMKAEMNRRLDTAAISWVNYAKRKLNERLNRDGKTPSPEGGYPAMATSNLRGKIEYDLRTQKMEARVGTNVLYGKFLELGTETMGKRPWMTLTNRAMRSTINRILGRRMK